MDMLQAAGLGIRRIHEDRGLQDQEEALIRR